MRKMSKRITSLVLTGALLFSLGGVSQVAEAASKKVKVSTKKVTVTVGTSKKVKVKNAPKKARITWRSKNKKIAKVKNGKITGKAEGSTKVICKVAYKKNSKKVTKKFTIKVKVNAATQVAPSAAATTMPTEVAAVSPTVVPTASLPSAVPVFEGDFVEMTGDELIQDMGAGWNLGNTMDGHTGFTPNETVWQSVKTTKKLIKSVHDMGFNTVRIPVTWGTMIDDENGYTIDEEWLNRVQDIVDYCISQDMYAIVNIHHDGAEQMGWIRIASEDQAALEEKFEAVWRNIATTFKDYDEHLILESMNEVKGQDMTVVEENQVIMKLNQIFVDTVRSTGSNNAKRWLMMPGKYNYVDSVCNPDNEFALPTDTVENRLIVSVHIYTPYNFCMEEANARQSQTTYSVKKLETNEKEIKPLYDTYTSKGIPVVVGEYGCINKDNPSERAFYLEGMNRIYKKYKCVGVYWDQGWYDRSRTPDYSFSIIDRETGTPIDKEVTDGLLRGRLGLTGETEYANLEKSPTIIPVTQLVSNVTQATLTIGEKLTVTMGYTPENSNDVILWKTADPNVATVYNGNIRAKGAGSTVITAFTQNGTATLDIPVTVNSRVDAVPCTDITLAKESYEMTEGERAWLNAQMTPAETGESLYYVSSNEDVVTVSSVGKLVATGIGTAIVTVYSTGGMSKAVNVTVAEEPLPKEIQLAVNVYYNDTLNSYFANETSNQVITVTEDGQYELSFDCESDLSAEAIAAGVSTINRVTAIYIKDYQVSQGKTSVSPLKSCDIHYDKIVVDGVELTLNTDSTKSALKDSGIFDTNDPINGWDGSVVDEVLHGNNVATFSTIENPKKITITFTLSNMVFSE